MTDDFHKSRDIYSQENVDSLLKEHQKQEEVIKRTSSQHLIDKEIEKQKQKLDELIEKEIKFAQLSKDSQIYRPVGRKR